MLKKLSKIFILLLLCDALIVFIIKCAKGDGWLLIAAYWLLLTIKNFLDWLRNKND